MKVNSTADLCESQNDLQSDHRAGIENKDRTKVKKPTHNYTSFSKVFEFCLHLLAISLDWWQDSPVQVEIS